MKVVLAVSLLASPVVGWSSLNMKAGKSERRWDLVWGSLEGNPVFGVHDVLSSLRTATPVEQVLLGRVAAWEEEEEAERRLQGPLPLAPR